MEGAHHQLPVVVLGSKLEMTSCPNLLIEIKHRAALHDDKSALRGAPGAGGVLREELPIPILRTYTEA